jgi:hypothetical protein
VEYSCHKCGANVEEGTAFCAQCAAPQIRVQGAAPEILPPAFAAPSQAPSITSLQWHYAVPSAVVAGGISALLMVVPLGGLGIGMLAGGVIAVMLYQRRMTSGNLMASQGARLGAVAGVFGFFIFATFTAIQVALFHSSGELRSALLEAVRQAGQRNSDPQAQPIIDFLRTPQGLAVVMALGLSVMFVFFIVLASAGGAITAALLRRKPNPGGG